MSSVWKAQEIHTPKPVLTRGFSGQMEFPKADGLRPQGSITAEQPCLGLLPAEPRVPRPLVSKVVPDRHFPAIDRLELSAALPMVTGSSSGDCLLPVLSQGDWRSNMLFSLHPDLGNAFSELGYGKRRG